MSRSFSNAKLLSVYASSAFGRRGYAAKSHGAATTSAKAGSAATLKKSPEQQETASRYKEAWGPDPKTGYYRPEGRAAEVDGAELRATFVKSYH